MAGKKKLDWSIELLIGALFCCVGLLVYYTRMFGVRGGGYTEGLPAQLSGLLFILFGVYRIFSAIRKITSRKPKQ